MLTLTDSAVRRAKKIADTHQLIDLLEKRNRTIEECSRYDAATTWSSSFKGSRSS